MKSLRSRCLALWMVVALLPLSGCSKSSRYQLVPGPNDVVYRIDTATGDAWKTTGAEWVLIRQAPAQRR